MPSRRRRRPTPHVGRIVGPVLIASRTPMRARAGSSGCAELASRTAPRDALRRLPTTTDRTPRWGRVAWFRNGGARSGGSGAGSIVMARLKRLVGLGSRSSAAALGDRVRPSRDERRGLFIAMTFKFAQALTASKDNQLGEYWYIISHQPLNSRTRMLVD